VSHSLNGRSFDLKLEARFRRRGDARTEGPSVAFADDGYLQEIRQIFRRPAHVQEDQTQFGLLTGENRKYGLAPD
jgi:hypothetical protein